MKHRMGEGVTPPTPTAGLLAGSVGWPVTPSTRPVLVLPDGGKPLKCTPTPCLTKPHRSCGGRGERLLAGQSPSPAPPDQGLWATENLLFLSLQP